MKIGLIGCGKVGITLFYLLKKDNQIIGVYDINKNREKKARRLLKIKENPSLKDLCKKPEAIFFATPDDQILKAYKKVRSFIKGKKYVFHFSGLLTAAIFPKSKNIYRGSIHPFATFPQVIIPPKQKKYFLFVEGDLAAKKAVGLIFKRRYFIIKTINKRQKINNHLLGVFASNFLVSLVSAIYKLVKKMNWREKDLHEIVFPIIDETLNNIKKYKIKNALSGPLERGDIEIIKRHLMVLKKDKVLLNTYKTLSLNIIKNVLKGKRRTNIEKLLTK